VQYDTMHRYLPAVAKPAPPPDDQPAGLPRLPPGRHGLSREFVSQNQRDRLTAGIIAVVAEHGYHDATITQIAAAAGVSRRTFYSYFSSKEECFFAAYQVIGAHLADVTRAAAAKYDAWPEQVRAQLSAALELFAANPDLARFYMIAPPRAGEEISARYRLASSRVIAQLTEGIPADTPAPTETVQKALAGGLASLIVAKVEAGEGEGLPGLLPDLVELFLTPFIGREEAVRVARSSS